MTERYNAANPKHVAEKREKLSDEARRNQDDLRGLLANDAFRRYVWRHIGVTCKLLETPMNNNGSVQSFNIGMQEVARILWAEIEAADALAIPRMMAETHQPAPVEKAAKPSENPYEPA